MKKSFAAAAVAALFLLSACGSKDPAPILTPDPVRPSPTETLSGVSGGPETNDEAITLEEYNRIAVGMDRPIAEGIIGSQGTVFANRTLGGINMTTVQYAGTDGMSNAMITYRDGVVANKSQVRIDLMTGKDKLGPRIEYFTGAEMTGMITAMSMLDPDTYSDERIKLMIYKCRSIVEDIKRNTREVRFNLRG